MEDREKEREAEGEGSIREDACIVPQVTVPFSTRDVCGFRLALSLSLSRSLSLSPPIILTLSV